ncbi:MAG: response regulator transcription factor [Hungatella sp.]|jgi:DNA-binding LytR/AlgR family response regulator|nr:response regulator transcription factor [Hungatella sp.]
MYQIALCDDEEKELDRIETYLAGYQDKRQTQKYRVRRFTSGEAMVDLIREELYMPDLILLDIFMSGITGMDAAKEMRGMGCGVPIIFLTTSRDHALCAYEVDAVQYLVKPLDQDRFYHAMDSAMSRMRKEQESQIVIKVAGGVRQLSPSDILYCESQKNYQILYLAGAECRVRMTTENLWKLLADFPQFGRCGRSYILNMDHIISVDREEILMDSGRAIYIPRNKATEFKKRYFAYYFQQGRA